MGIALFLAVVLVYMILAAQFDSFVQPLTIMLSLPLSVVGAFGGLFLTGKTLNIFSMIGVIMLMGLVTKNAILLVDFANQLRAEGRSVHEALVEAGIDPAAADPDDHRRDDLRHAAGRARARRGRRGARADGDLRDRRPDHLDAADLVVVPVAYSLSQGMIDSRPMRWMSERLFGRAAPAVRTFERLSDRS